MSRRVFLDADMVPASNSAPRTPKSMRCRTQELPQGVHLVETGNTEFMTELVDGFLLAIGAGILMVLAVLVLLFVRVFSRLPFCRRCRCRWEGAVLALLLTGVPFSLPVMIGILMLMGIVARIRSSVILHRGDARRKAAPRAIMEAGHKRARPSS